MSPKQKKCIFHLKKTQFLQENFKTEKKIENVKIRNQIKTQIERMIFNKTTGFKLTKLGFQLLKKEYDTYKFPVAEGLHNKLLLKLHSHMQWPYALERKHLYLFSEDDAMWLKLVGDDVEKFTNSLD